MDFLEMRILNNDLKSWGMALATFIFIFILLRISKNLLKRKVERIAVQTITLIDDLIVLILQDIKLYTIFFLALYYSTYFLILSPSISNFLYKIFVLVFTLQAAIWGTSIIQFWIKNFLQKRAQEDVSSATTLGLVSFLIRALLYGMLVLLALNNLGVDITALVAGLGVGGIAIALAVQNILGDLFASLTIVLDKPFVVGDFIAVDQFLGDIEHIGLKTTRLRSLSGEQLVFPNSNLLQSRIRNYKRMNERRILFNLGVTYQTPYEKLEKIPQIIRSIIEAQKLTRFDRCHFKGYGAFSLDYETVFWVLDREFNIYMDIQQKINLEIFKAFQAQAIEFAYPTQTVFLEKQISH